MRKKFVRRILFIFWSVCFVVIATIILLGASVLGADSYKHEDYPHKYNGAKLANVAQAAELVPENPEDNFPVLLPEWGFMYYDTTQTFPAKHFRVHWNVVTPTYRNHVVFESKNLFGVWTVDYTIDVISTGSCSVEDPRLPAVCWEDSNFVRFETDGSKILQSVVKPLHLPLVGRNFR
jgi:hypothetical protein